MKKSIEDLMIFGRVVSAAVLVCGYILLGAYLARQLLEKGYPQWSALLLFFSAALLGLWQAWLFLRPLWRKK